MFLVAGDNGTGFPSWYLYKQSATDNENLPSIVASADNVGRWFQFGGGNGGGSSIISGNILCTSGAPRNNSGKAFEFTSYGNFFLIIAVDNGVSLVSGSTSIIVHLWTQEPNVAQVGKIEPRIIALPQTGGDVGVAIRSTNKWLTLGAKFTGTNFYDAPYFTITGNTLTIVGR
ncbi:hypothetical protein [Nostoc sp. CHAB 5836]|uniref:hypothetical protein n=1 Tax=Nostoc sp. CHAB 5836 TaxID=2780404 RepID=UPI001E612CE4|nr:hypothetical protein [Nostoc sp. CHAB 5836]